MMLMIRTVQKVVVDERVTQYGYIDRMRVYFTLISSTLAYMCVCVNVDCGGGFVNVYIYICFR